jgi:hypothetical protein
MQYSVYKLLDVDTSASPHLILEKCKDYYKRWTLNSIRNTLQEKMNASEAAVNAEIVHKEGLEYIKSIATMLLDPSARQCYDAWLDVQISPSAEKNKLTRSLILWFNQTNQSIKFSEQILKTIAEEPVELIKPSTKRRKIISNPKCRVCRSDFDFAKDYLVLHCHCTTRVGHVECLSDFSKRVTDKCPVCRQTLLKRHQVSKYLFWNVKEKYKFIT